MNRIQWQKQSFPLLFPSVDTVEAIGSNKFAVPSFEVYESKALLEVGRCDTLTKGGMDDCWVDGYTQPRFLLRPMSLITLQGEAVRLFSVQYYKHRDNLGYIDARSKNIYGGGFVIGDGTGVGKSREIAGMIVTTILVEQYLNKKKNILCRCTPPLIIWLTCSEQLFATCKKAFAEVLTLTKKNKYSLKNMTNNGLTTIDLEGDDLFIQFMSIKQFLTDTPAVQTTNSIEPLPPCSRFSLLHPTVLFLTYNGLMINFENIMNVFKEEVMFPTAMFCDEFHKIKNISDKMRLAINNRNKSGNDIRSLYAIMHDTFDRNKKNNRLQLNVADSMKLFVDHLKSKTFLVMSSATPFQNNQDLHTIDHIIRNIAPRYHLLDQYDGTPTGMNSSEYSTLFLESIIKLLYNHGIYVSRTISMNGIRCSIVQKPISTATTFMIDEISSYLAEMKNLAKTAHSDIIMLNHIIDQIIKSQEWRSSSALIDGLKTFAETINAGKHNSVKLRSGYKLVFTEWNNAWKYLYDGQQQDDENDGLQKKKIKLDESVISLSSVNPLTTSKVFRAQPYRFLSGQLKVNLAAFCVAINKNILLSLKNKSVLKYIQTVRKQKEPQKMVVSIEQTGDSFYNHIINEIRADKLFFSKEKNVININRLSVLDKAPASHFIINAYKTLLKSLLLDTTYRIVSLEKETMCFFLLPRLPPPAPLILLDENFLDQIEVGVGEGRYIEVTKRKYSGRLMSEGTLEIVPINTSMKNTDRDFQLFKHSSSVDVAIVGKSGNTGFDFHDSRDNIAQARRIHIIADLPHDAISFLQSIGRTHRNNQRSLPRYCLFLTNIPTEKRFVDTLESRVRDSKAGTYGDRYCQNTLSLKKNEKNITTINNEKLVEENNKKSSDNDNSSRKNVCIDKIDFLENEFVMKVLGITLQLLAGEYNPLDLFFRVAKLGYRNGYLFIPIEGLGDSKFYLSIVEFAFECASVLLVEHNSSNKKKYKPITFQSGQAARATVLLIDKQKRQKILDEILECLCYFYDSSIMDVGLRGYTIDKKEIQRVVSTSIQFWKIFSPSKMTKRSHLLAAVARLSNEDKKKKSNISIETIFHRSAITIFAHDDVQLPPPMEVLTVSTHNDTAKFVMGGCLSNIPTVVACNLLYTLKEKTPQLFLDICNEITPYRKENGNNVDSCLLSLSRLLVNKGLTYKQFRNYFMPLSEQKLLHSLFSKVREWLSTEEWFSRMCMMRKANYISAEYTRVIMRPHDINQLYARVDNDDINNIICDSNFIIECQLSLCSDNEKMKKINTGSDITIRLTPDNTIFINTLFNTLLLTNARRDMVKFKFSNCNSFGLPSIALVCYQ